MSVGFDLDFFEGAELEVLAVLFEELQVGGLVVVVAGFHFGYGLLYLFLYNGLGLAQFHSLLG